MDQISQMQGALRAAERRGRRREQKDLAQQGIAADILGVFENFARGNHLAFLTLEVRASNTAARALYGKLGYLQTGMRRGYYEHPKEDAIIMTLEFDYDTETIEP